MSIIQVKIKEDKTLGLMPAQIKKITAGTLNDAVFFTRGVFVASKLDELLDRPTPTFKRLLAVIKKATPTDLTAIIGYKGEKAKKIVDPIDEGGQRNQKKFDDYLISQGVMASNYISIPARDLPKNQYGNLSIGIYNKVIAALKSGQGITKRNKGKKSGVKEVIFAVKDKGVFSRSGADRNISLIFFFKPATSAKAHLKLEQNIRSEVIKQFDKSLSRNIQRNT